MINTSDPKKDRTTRDDLKQVYSPHAAGVYNVGV
jgi:hypothetical protein